MRIVSLLPSATEIIAELGLKHQLVGISHACDYPKDILDLPVVTQCNIPKNASSLAIDATVRDTLEQSTALYALDTETLAALAPDCLVTQALCDVCAVSGADVEACIEELPGNPAIVNLEPFSLDDVLKTITKLGTVLSVEDQAEKLHTQLENRIKAVAARTEKYVKQRPRTLVLDWIDPPFVSGHWMHDLIALAGGDDMTGRTGTPSYSTTWEEVEKDLPDVLVIACCGFNVNRTHQELEQSGVQKRLNGYKKKGVQIDVVDGNALFSRPGPRLVDSLELLAHRLHPDIHPEPNIILD